MPARPLSVIINHRRKPNVSIEILDCPMLDSPMSSDSVLRIVLQGKQCYPEIASSARGGHVFVYIELTAAGGDFLRTGGGETV